MYLRMRFSSNFNCQSTKSVDATSEVNVIMKLNVSCIMQKITLRVRNTRYGSWDIMLIVSIEVQSFVNWTLFSFSIVTEKIDALHLLEHDYWL